MTNKLVLHTPTSMDVDRASELIALGERANKAAQDAVAANTRRAYDLELHCFMSWCDRIPVPPTPATPEVVQLYLQELFEVGRSSEDLPRGKPKGPLGYSALMRTLAAICTSNIDGGHPSVWNDPIIEKQRRAFASKLTVAPKRKKKGVGSAESLLFRICDLMDDSPIGIRDRAMVLVGWHGGKRRSEIAAALVEHFQPTESGNVRWTIPRSKTDQTGKGLVVFLPRGKDVRYCPVRALDRWLKVSEICSGHVFRSLVKKPKKGALIVKDAGLDPSVVSLRLKHYVAQLGLDPRDFGGHSLRRGFITTARKQGARQEAIMAITGHTDPKTLYGYIEDDDKENESVAVGLLDGVLAARPQTMDEK